MLCTVAALPGAAAREIRAWDGVATSCVDRRATDAPDAASLTGRLQELGAQHRARILLGALTLALASRAPPRLSWSTTFKRGLTVVRGLGIFVLKNHLVPVEGIWGRFAQCQIWFRNLNKTPLNFLKPSSQVNNFTVFFNFSLECEKVFFQSAWVTSQFPVQTNLVWKTREN